MCNFNSVEDVEKSQVGDKSLNKETKYKGEIKQIVKNNEECAHYYPRIKELRALR